MKVFEVEEVVLKVAVALEEVTEAVLEVQETSDRCCLWIEWLAEVDEICRECWLPMGLRLEMEVKETSVGGRPSMISVLEETVLSLGDKAYAMFSPNEYATPSGNCLSMTSIVNGTEARLGDGCR
jgi:hypothetical protein